MKEHCRITRSLLTMTTGARCAAFPCGPNGNKGAVGAKQENEEDTKMATRQTARRIATTILSAIMFLGAPTFASATNQFAVWLNGQATDGGNPIPNRLNIAFGAGAVTLVSTAQLETPGFLDSFDCVVISRF